MTQPLDPGLIRILDARGRPVGAGFLVAGRQAVTCAHVIATALPGAPAGEVALDFPRLPSHPRLAALVTLWDDLADIAGLELIGDLPQEARPVRLVRANDLWGHSFRAFGFPGGFDNGVWASGRILEQDANGWLQIEDIKTTGYAVQPGFSGGPLWDEALNGVIGMVVAADNRPGVRAAYGLPTAALITAWPTLDEQAIPPCPYRGLFAFREQDAPFFFGREDFTGRLVEAVQRRAFVAVIVGPSGSGKSSIVFAGMIPRLRQDATWVIADFRPGQRPFHSLAAALLHFLEPELSETDRLIESGKLADSLLNGSLRLIEVAEHILQKSTTGRDSHLLLVADQFEELYTLCPEADLRRQFIDSLLAAVEVERQRATPSFTFVLTLRADFMGQALAYRPFADALQDSSLMLGPMTRVELERAIENPARKLGVDFEVGLVARILEHVGDQPGNLPLLEFALTLIWERQENNRLTHAAYDAIGEIAGALARYAEEVVYAGLSQGEQDLIRKALMKLVHPGEGTEDTRRVATRGEFSDEEWALVQRMADLRMVVTGQDPATRQETAEIIHEALIQHWDRLREWVDSDRLFLSWQERTRAALRLWEEKTRDEGALLRGALLTETESWLARRGADLSAAEREFILAGIALREQAARERELHRQRALESARRIRLALGVITLLSVMFSAALYAFLSTTYRFSLVDYAFGRGIVKRENPFIPLSQGQMIFGSDTPDLGSGEQPSQTVFVQDFAIQQTEVTNRQYRICRQAGGCQSDPIIRKYYADPAYQDHPVVYVNAFQASEFCRWLAGDLPTSEQWERAARGLDGRPWPWLAGDLSADRANSYFPDSPPDGALKARDFPSGATPEGVLNLVGNVWEWTRTQLVPHDDGADYSSLVWDGVDREAALVMRGGSWGFEMTRITEVQIASSEENFSEFLGFRCILPGR